MGIRIVFMGSPEFSIPSLKALVIKFEVIGVVTKPDRPAGRGRIFQPPPIKELAQDFDLPIIQPQRASTPEVVEQLEEWNPDVIVVAAYGQILKKIVLELPDFGCVNVHASLLPRWRGAAPINAAILHGDNESGITIMKMDEGLDTGPILSQRSMKIKPTDTAGTLSSRLAELGSEQLIETLPRYISGEISPQPQDSSMATYAPMLKKEDGKLDFTQPAVDLARKVRAFSPWPGAYTQWRGNVLKIHQAHPVTGISGTPGRNTLHENLPAIFTSNGALVLDEVQPGGKKRMPGKVFLHGARGWGKED
jgi:methionyl-tRNA formyltransferase